MILQKMPHYVDSILTQEDASAALQDGQVVVGLYTNRENVQSVVHSHPYYEMILPVAGSSVRYSVDGSVYDLHLGELILFPGEMYHSGKFNITDTTSERLVVQIAPGIWERAWAQSGLPRHVWSGDPVILDTDAVTQWDFRGLLERMAQTVYLDEKIRDTVQCCEVTELILLISQVVTRRHNAPPPSATSLLVAKAVAYLQANYTDPHLTVAQLAKYTYTSREHLSRVFKEYTLESIHGYLTNLRMQHCRNELADGTGVLDACTASGFANYSSFLKELLTVGKKLRSYITSEKAAVPDLFIKMFAGGRPITAEEYNALTAVRMENTGKVCGVFDVNFDKREFSAVHIMDGWQTWAMRDVSVASYHATRSYFASADEQWRKLLNHLNGKEITSAGHLSAQNFSFGEEIIESDGKLNFYLQADFDVDAAFGTFVCTDQNDDWLNIYANYDVEQDRLCNTLDLNLCKGDGSEEDWSYPLNAAEQEVLLCKMEAFCQQQTGMSLHEYARQLRDSETQAPEMQM